MSDTVTIERAPVVKAAARRRSAKVVSASALALHLDCSRTYIGKLEAEGVLHRDGGGFDVDASRVAYLRFLRAERRQSPRGETDRAHAAAKTTLLQIRIEERRRTLVRRDEHEAMIDQMAGLVLTKLGGWPSRIAGTDLVLRRCCASFAELAEACTAKADQNGEPPLDADA